MRLLLLVLSVAFCGAFRISDLFESFIDKNDYETENEIEDHILPVFLITFFGALFKNILFAKKKEEFVQAVLITGGFSSGKSGSSAEIYIPSNSSSCVLPRLPVFRADHSLDGGLACGGQSCNLWNPETGSWDLSHTLTGSPRYIHASWTPGPETGTYVIGGFDSPKSVQLANTDGTVEPEVASFLRYDTMYACGIPDGNQFIVTGGVSRGRNIDNVHVYNTDGWIRDLPSLNIARSDHACASFIANGERFLLVTGGWSSFYSAISDETEIFTESQASWRTLSARLPVPVYVPKAVSIGNRVLLFGGDDYVGSFYDEILEFSPESESWTLVDMTRETRAAHAISVVNFKDFAEHCDFSRRRDEPRAPPSRPENRQHMWQKKKFKVKKSHNSKHKGHRVKV